MPLLVFCRLLGRLLSWLPEGWVQKLTIFFGDVLFRLPLKKVRVLQSNLHHAFPDRDPDWRDRVARKTCHRLMEMAAYGLASPFFDEAWYWEHMEAPAAVRRCCQEAASGGGLLLVPHVTLFEMLCALPIFVPAALGEPVIYRPINQHRLDRWIKETRERWGVKLVSRREGMSAINRLVREKRSIAMLFDQNVGKRGCRFFFMQRLASGTHYPGLLARKFDLVPCFIHPRRTGFWRARLVSTSLPKPVEPIDLVRTSHAALEEYLRESEDTAADWLWFHTRWKTSKSPQHQFQLRESDGCLEKSARLSGLPSLPRRTRYWIRLPNWLGDAVMALPLIRALNTGRPDAEITLIAGARLAPLLERACVADDVVRLPEKRDGIWRYFRFFSAKRKAYPDVYVCLTNSFRGDLEAWLTRAPQRFGMLRPGKWRPLLTAVWRVPRPLDETRCHQLDVWEAMFRYFGLSVPLDKRPLQGGWKPEPGVIGLIPGTENDPSKRWPVGKWREVIDSLLVGGLVAEIRLFGTPRDVEIAERVGRDWNDARVKNLAGKTTLGAFMEGLATCDVVVCNDTGGMHLANFLGVPVVVIFGPTNPVRTGPVFEGAVEILQPEGCPAWGGSPIQGVRPERVMAAIVKRLETGTKDRRTAPVD